MARHPYRAPSPRPSSRPEFSADSRVFGLRERRVGHCVWGSTRLVVVGVGRHFEYGTGICSTSQNGYVQR